MSTPISATPETANAIPALVDTAWLSRQIDEGNDRIAVVGIFSGHGDPAEAVALPGTPALHWKQLLWDERQRQFVGRDTLLRRLQQAGVDTSAHLVFYGEPTQFAFYARWASLRAGLKRVSVLDGGLRAWRASGLPVAPLPVSALAAPQSPADNDLQGPARASADIRIGRDQLLQRLGEDGLQLLDIRTSDEYEGLRVGPDGGNHGAERAGHIPGARLLPFASLLDEHSRLRPLPQLQALASQAGLDAGQPTVVYCRLSHRSTLAFFALTELLGFRDVRVYDGSWTEWGSLVGAPIATGSLAGHPVTAHA